MCVWDVTVAGPPAVGSLADTLVFHQFFFLLCTYGRALCQRHHQMLPEIHLCKENSPSWSTHSITQPPKPSPFTVSGFLVFAVNPLNLNDELISTCCTSLRTNRNLHWHRNGDKWAKIEWKEEGESLSRLQMDCNNMLLACVTGVTHYRSLMSEIINIASVAQDTIKGASYRDARTKQSSHELHNNQQIV